MKYIIGALIILGAGALMGALATLRTNTSVPAIATSFYPLTFLTERIAGDAYPVFSITPYNTEPHDYELTPETAIRLTKSPLFIHTGAQLEPWADAVVASRAAQNLPSLGLLNAKNALTSEDAEHALDPHFWLSPRRALVVVDQIASALTRIYPNNEAIFTANAQKLTEQLTEIDTAYITKLAACSSRSIVTDHDAFGYLAHDYNLTVHSIRGISPDEEPSSATIASLADFVRTNDITTIFTEELVTPDIAETLAREAGVTTGTLSTIEGLTDTDIAAHATYLTKLDDNLTVLTRALSCK